MSTLSDKLAAASKTTRRGGGNNIIDQTIAVLSAREQKDLISALSDFDVTRGIFRVSARQISDILKEEKYDISPTAISSYRMKQGYRETATQAAIKRRATKES